MHPRPTRHNTPESAPVGDWRNQAACRGMDTELFFPTKGNVEQAIAAKAVCTTCTVQAECLNDALSYEANRDFGILGGLDEDERAALRRRRNRAQLYLARRASSSLLR